LLVGSTIEVMVDSPGVARSHREAPEIDGIVRVSATLPAGSTHLVTVTGAAGPDLEADVAVPLLAGSESGAVREAS
jgi:hypothetical protein